MCIKKTLIYFEEKFIFRCALKYNFLTFNPDPQIKPSRGWTLNNFGYPCKEEHDIAPPTLSEGLPCITVKSFFGCIIAESAEYGIKSIIAESAEYGIKSTIAESAEYRIKSGGLDNFSNFSIHVHELKVVLGIECFFHYKQNTKPR